MSYGLDLLKIRENSKILLPEIICDVAVKVFTKKNLKIQFYKLNKNFEPNWSQLENLNCKNVSAILMVHFFGYPQNFTKFLNFTKRKKIFLIEDNCHSLPIKYRNRVLGKIGDIGIDSPRKIINELYSGGRLFVNFNQKLNKIKLDYFELKKKDIIKKKLKENFKTIYSIYKFKGNRPNFESPYLYSDQDNDFKVKKIDKKSLNMIKKINFKHEVIQRKNIYLKIDRFVKSNNMKPIFKLKKNIIPMYYVAQTRNLKHTKKIFDWGWKNKIQIVSWPSFYKKFKISKELKSRWEKYICIPLNQQFPKKYGKRI